MQKHPTGQMFARFLIVVAIAVVTFATASTHAGTQSESRLELAQATTDPMVCLKTCMDQYGASKKNSCALQCGFGGDATAGAAPGQKPKVDCGVQYKRCMNGCKAEKTNAKACQSQCRETRTSCI